MKPGGPSDRRTLREQLIPLATALRSSRAVIQPVSQVHFKLKPDGDRDRLAEAGKCVLQWMDNRAGRKLPQQAWRLESFELADVGAQRTAAVALADPRFWAARLDDADKVVPQRTWITEVGLGMAPDGSVLFGTRLICASRGESPPPFDRTIPGFVRAIASLKNAQLDGFPIAQAPQVVATEEEVERLVDLLTNPARKTAVVVFALPVHGTDPQQTVVPPRTLLEQATGAVHVRILTGPGTFLLTEKVGKELSVFDRAVRFYRPGFNHFHDHPSRHPLYLPARIETWPGGGVEFTKHLVEHALAATVQRPDREDEVPPFNAVRQYAAEAERQRARAAGSSSSEMGRLYEEDNVRLRKEIEEQKELSDSLLKVAESEREQAERGAQEARAQTFALRERIRALERKLQKSSERRDEVQIPSSLEALESWCAENLSGAVELHNRAFNGAKKSRFEDPSLIYRALLMLRDDYVPMKLEGGIDRVQAYESSCKALQLEDSAVGTALQTHRDVYTVIWNGRPRVLERHLKKGKRHDETHCFRLYYFWDDEAQCVVVGWLPSHLDNSLT